MNSNTEESSALDRAAVACKDRLAAYYNVTSNANICDDAGHEFYVCILLCICIVIYAQKANNHDERKPK